MLTFPFTILCEVKTKIDGKMRYLVFISQRGVKGKVSIIPYIFGVAMPRQAQKCKNYFSRVKNVAAVST